jgi:hypothetical protein
MRRQVASLLTVVLMGCASGQGNGLPEGVERGRTIVETPAGQYDVTTFRVPDIASRAVSVSLGQAWSALPAAYEKLGLSLETANAASHLAGTGFVTVHRSLAGTPLSKYMVCGYSALGIPSANVYAVLLRVRTQLSETTDGKTLVRTLLEATAHEEGSSTDPVECSTTGTLERRLAELLTNSPA